MNRFLELLLLASFSEKKFGTFKIISVDNLFKTRRGKIPKNKLQNTTIKVFIGVSRCRSPSCSTPKALFTGCFNTFTVKYVQLMAQYFILSFYTLCMIVLVVLWLQSGLDKITDYKGNFDWLNGHFSKSPLKGMVKFLLITLTLFELTAGLSSVMAIIDIWFLKLWYFPFIACFTSMLAFTSLFFGQRMAKDYGSAASIVGYLVYILFVLLFTALLPMLLTEKSAFTVYPFGK